VSLELRPVTGDELDGYLSKIAFNFGWRTMSEESIALNRATTELDRSLAAFESGRLVGTAGVYSFELGLPGGVTAPAAGVTRVTVAPTHRRQGVLRQLMRRQLDGVHERGESLAILYASEAAIYGRFGYGVGTWHSEFSLSRSRSAFVEPLRPRVELLSKEEARGLIDFHNRLVARQPGMVRRSQAWWDQVQADPPEWRGKGGERQYAVHRGGGDPAGEVDGFVTFRVETKWENGDPQGTVHVGTLLADRPEAFAELWRFCLDIDLMAGVEASTRPLNDPLRHLLADPRALHARVHDGIWMRLVDVPAALSARRYQVEDTVAFEVVDDFCPWNTGRWELAGGPGGAECRRSSRDPDLTLTAAQLGWCYLGANRFGDIVAAGRAGGDAAAARRADAMFVSLPEAWCPTHF
jgi:predicted acetyltransferase